MKIKNPLKSLGDGQSKFNWKVLAVFAAFFLVIGAVRIFGFENTTGNIVASSVTGSEASQSAHKVTPVVEKTSSNPSVASGAANELVLEDLYIIPDETDPLKVKIKLAVKNYGSESAGGLVLKRTSDGVEQEYGPYKAIIKKSMTRSYTKKFSEPGEHTITFEIMDYSGFGKDADKSNNIKTLTFNLEA